MIRRSPHRTPFRTRPLAWIFAAFCAGMIVEWGLHHYGPPLPAAIAERSEPRTLEPRTNEPRTVEPRTLEPTTLEPKSVQPKIDAVPTTGVSTGGALRMPLDGVKVDAMKGGFYEKRAGGSRGHEAVDLLAPRNTPIHAVEDGTIAKLFTSKAGGLTIYQFDPPGRLVYYYAHLQRYADGIHEGQAVAKGDVIGYVGTSGNAPPDTPHLHFAVFQTNGNKQWWKGMPIDPYPIFRDRLQR
jgi:murein DD-endopeptidase MepM/ murein hydrolase activator NlpD